MLASVQKLLRVTRMLPDLISCLSELYTCVCANKHGSCQKATLDILDKNLVLMWVLPHLQDTWMAPHQQYGGMLCSSSAVFVYD